MENSAKTFNKADIIIVLPGDSERLLAACSLVKQNYSQHFAVINKTAEQLKTAVNAYEPLPNAHYLPGGTSRSTFEDIYNVFNIITNNNFSSLILVTSSYHMPRALYLLKFIFLFSKHSCKIQYLPVITDKKISLRKKVKLYFNENIKIWGSTFEALGFQISNNLLLDNPTFSHLSKLINEKLLFRL